MPLQFTFGRGTSSSRPRLTLLVVAVALLCLTATGWAADPAAAPPPAPPAAAAPAATPAGDMGSAGWLEGIAMRLEHAAMSDVSMLPDTPAALVRQWRSFDRNGSALGALVNVGWVVLAACLAWLAERAAARGLSRRLRRGMHERPEGPTVIGLLLLLLCDAIGVAVFAGVFVYSRHWLTQVGVPMNLILLGAQVLIRWRIAALVVQTLLRPRDRAARLVELPEAEVPRLGRFMSGAFLASSVLVGFGRYGLDDVDSGAPHIIGLIVAVLMCALYALIVYRARHLGEALIRGNSSGLFGALRASIARSWLAIGMTGVVAMLLFFVFGLSLGLLSYYRAAVSSLAVLLILLVLERLADRGGGQGAPASGRHRGESEHRLVARSFLRLLRTTLGLVGLIMLAWIWIDAIELPRADASQAMTSAATAIGTMFVAYLIWELSRLAIDRHLPASAGPKMPGDDDDETAPGSRLQTVLPMLRVVFGVAIGVVATLVVLSHLGINTAPLIAGAGVFGLALSFGSQSLVRDVISGLFYMWDDAFRVGEYIDTGRLKGTVEALGVRSVKVRHHNGPLHTIPYGQLGSVTNQSRDFATIKFNVRLEPGTDVELVRKTVKRIGIDMQQQPEIAAEVILPLKMQGIVEVTETAVVMRFKFTARPVKPSWVQREYLKRMYRVFSEKGIAFASGALTLRTGPAGGAEGEAARVLSGDPTGPVAVPAATRVA
jgi:small-conductance mechanosensitive channel